MISPVISVYGFQTQQRAKDNVQSLGTDHVESWLSVEAEYLRIRPEVSYERSSPVGKEGGNSRCCIDCKRFVGAD